MSDRREAVARAIGNALITRSDIAAVADAAIAAYEATEPTEAEVEAACEAFAFEWPIHSYTEPLGDRDEGEAWHPSFEGAIYAALIAARTARP